MTSQTPTQSPTPTRSEMDAARERVLVRRRNTLMVLGGLVLITLVLALVTGSVIVLVVSLAADIGLAAYIAYLLRLKQGRDAG